MDATEPGNRPDPGALVGIDLSGPVGTQRTVLVAFGRSGSGLRRLFAVQGADDRRILDAVESLLAEGPVVVGIDAPLSYQEGGGDRPADRRLRRQAVACGLAPGTVMPPTLTRMAYLTLRGIAVSRMLENTGRERGRLVEVHPAVAMAIRGAPIGDVRQFTRSQRSRQNLLAWLEGRGLEGAAGETGSESDHYVAACAAALAAWHWQLGTSAFREPARPPLHPYDVVC